jgi:hypothetical protein
VFRNPNDPARLSVRHALRDQPDEPILLLRQRPTRMSRPRPRHCNLRLLSGVATFAGICPRKAGTDLGEGQVAADLKSMRMAMAVNTLGLPAVAVPVGIQDGLPQAVQLIGPRYREDLCLDAAGALEEQVGIISPIDPR